MSTIRNSETKPVQGPEGSQIRQYFHPHNTLNGIRFSIAHFTLKPGKRTLRHKLKSGEVYFVLKGDGVLRIDSEKASLGRYDSAYVPPMTEQSIENVGDSELEFLCIVDPAWKQEDEIILE